MVKKIILFLITVSLCLYLGYFWGKKINLTEETRKRLEEETKPTAETEVNKSLLIPIPEQEEGVSFTITEAKKVKIISMKNNPIRADPDKEFLVLSLEIENNLTEPVNINSQDYIRLVSEEGKRYAPEFYNQTIEVPALSIKRDELGFIVPAGQNQFKLLVGPIEEEKKEEVEIVF